MLRKLMYLSIVVLIGVLLWKFVWNQPPPPENITPEGKVAGQVLDSPRFPAMKFQFTPEFKYVGAQRFQMKASSDVEQHVWAETDAEKHIQRLFWLQYEGFLPNNDFTFDYEQQPLNMQHGGLQWKCNMFMIVPRRDEDPDTDGARFRSFLRSKGVHIPPQYVQLRCFHVAEDGRNELMMIYLEDSEITEWARKPRPVGADKKIVRPPTRVEVRNALLNRLKERVQISK